ncbi:hypothetical protein B0H11DRAFT_2203152 [Mycena galericulata]|nr:hypothetical protein B0H11DRAFT_2203152 [Mycena galericulata]
MAFDPGCRENNLRPQYYRDDPVVGLTRSWVTYSTENNISSPYMLLQRCALAKGGYKSIFNQERFARSLAETIAAVFSVTLPEIGAVVDITFNGRPGIGPLAKRGGRPDALARIALVHTDSNADNILNNAGLISGLIDWEVLFHPLHRSYPQLVDVFRKLVVSGVFGCTLSSLLRSDGIWDPSFEVRDEKRYRYPPEWPATFQELYIFAAFLETCTASKTSSEFFQALEGGEKLCQLFEWLEFSSWGKPLGRIVIAGQEPRVLTLAGSHLMMFRARNDDKLDLGLIRGIMLH